MTYQLHHGDCIDIMPMIERESIDAIVTDPPYGLGFMGKDWDHGVPGEHFWREAYRVAKPGAHLLAFGGDRTHHRLMVAIEDAGWEIRTCIYWIFGSGFPKSLNVSKQIDKQAGAEREVIGTKLGRPGMAKDGSNQRNGFDSAFGGEALGIMTSDITAPATPAAQEWDGWGTALKPAAEIIIVARKPLAGTVAENVQRYGTGAINVDGCRIETDIENEPDTGSAYYLKRGIDYPSNFEAKGSFPINHKPSMTIKGRWPANLIHDGSAEVLAGFPMTSSGARIDVGRRQRQSGFAMTGGDCESSTGSAARFFYCAKASKADRDEGCEGLEETLARRYGEQGQGPTAQQTPRTETAQRNHHPTVKPTALMRYLCRLVTPPAGVILDPFMGSGSTGKAAILEGFNFVGIDTNLEYVEIAARRIEHACGKMGIVIDQPMLIESRREMADKPKQMILL